MTVAVPAEAIDAVSHLVRERAGIVLGPGKRSLVEARLLRLMRRHGLTDASALRDLLSLPQNEDLRRAIVESMTTNVTAFFREPAHFDALAEAIPSWQAKLRAGGRIRLWSAGCASGEEAYSMAATLLHHWPDCARADLRILATDLSSAMIRKARAGIYPAGDLPENPALHRVLSPTADRDSLSVSPEARRLIRFETLNLLGDWPFRGRFDAIFCRNVVIYFDEPTRERLWLRFAAQMEPGGMLCLGHAERIDEARQPQFERCGITRYRRSGAPLPADAGAQFPKVSACP